MSPPSLPVNGRSRPGTNKSFEKRNSITIGSNNNTTDTRNGTNYSPIIKTIIIIVTPLPAPTRPWKPYCGNATPSPTVSITRRIYCRKRMPFGTTCIIKVGPSGTPTASSQGSPNTFPRSIASWTRFDDVGIPTIPLSRSSWRSVSSLPFGTSLDEWHAHACVCVRDWNWNESGKMVMGVFFIVSLCHWTFCIIFMYVSYIFGRVARFTRVFVNGSSLRRTITAGNKIIIACRWVLGGSK